MRYPVTDCASCRSPSDFSLTGREQKFASHNEGSVQTDSYIQLWLIINGFLFCHVLLLRKWAIDNVCRTDGQISEKGTIWLLWKSFLHVTINRMQKIIWKKLKLYILSEMSKFFLANIFNVGSILSFLFPRHKNITFDPRRTYL